MEKILDKLAQLIVEHMWNYIEPLLVRSVEEGIRRGINYGYIEGHQDGVDTGTEDVIRRMTYVYDFVRHAAEADAYLKTMDAPIEEISDEEFQAIVDDMESV